MLEIDSVSKKYKDFTAIQDISMTVSGGEVFGLLGPNGAGKTTLLRIIATLIKPTLGTVKVSGFDIIKDAEDVRSRIGVVNGGMGLPSRLTGREILRSFSSLHCIDKSSADQRIAELDKELELGRTLDTRAGEYSTGMKQKILIARAVLHSPKILILDEASSGLDIFARRMLLDFVIKMQNTGRIIIYSTHVMSEAEEICDRVAIIHKGKQVKIDHISNILAETKEKNLERAFFSLIGGK